MKSLKITRWILLVAILVVSGWLLFSNQHKKEKSTPIVGTPIIAKDSTWMAPDTSSLDQSAESDLIRYGRELIVNTSYYLGPKGKVGSYTNGMNCQNCHLDAGTRPWGNNYGGVYAMYPLFRERSGSIETIHKRVSDCIQRSLNGKVPDSASKEMQAIETYIAWVGKNVPRKTKPKGAGIKELPLLDRAADVWKGKDVYVIKCQRCHGVNGEGTKNPIEGSFYKYPPLWGNDSYNTGAGLFRLSRFAGYVKSNMPFDNRSDTSLSVEEAWDVAAFVNSQPRPRRNFKQDWPNISKKPFDHPFGPYTDGFSAAQHKYGPFGPIKKKREAIAKL